MVARAGAYADSVLDRASGGFDPSPARTESASLVSNSGTLNDLLVSGGGGIIDQMALDRQEARQLAEQELDGHHRPDLDLVFLDDMTEEVPEGWVFFWDDRRHTETGRVEFAIGGGGPIFVARSGYLVHLVCSGESWHTALARYRATGTMRESWLP
jgi:hypothetical protein